VKLQQLRYVVEIVRRGNHLSAAAHALNQIVFTIAQRIATDVAALKRLKSDMTSGNSGVFTIGTTPFQARYTLPRVVEQFIKRYPEVRLELRQGDAEEIRQMVEAGDVDFAIGTETAREFPNLVKLDCFEARRMVVAPMGHPILSVPHLTLAEIARYPIITYDQRYSGRWKVMKAFHEAGLEPHIIMSGIDADVCKSYVALGLGIGILATMAHDPEKDAGIAIRETGDLIPSSTIQIALRPNTYLRPFQLEFIRAIAPHLTPVSVREAVQTFQNSRGAD